MQNDETNVKLANLQAISGIMKSLRPVARPLVTGVALSQGANALSNAAGEGDLSTLSQVGVGAAGAFGGSRYAPRAFRRMSSQMIIPSLIGSYIFRKQKQNFGGAVTDPKVVARLAKQHTSDAVAGVMDSARKSPVFKSIFGYNQKGNHAKDRSRISENY